MATRELRRLTVEERNRLDDVLAGLAPDDWDRPTACAGWTTRDLLAHVVAWDDLLLYTTRLGYPSALARWAAAMTRARFDPHRFNRLVVERDAQGPDLLLRFQSPATARARWLFERAAPGSQLAEYLIHRLDVAAAAWTWSSHGRSGMRNDKTLRGCES